MNISKANAGSIHMIVPIYQKDYAYEPYLIEYVIEEKKANIKKESVLVETFLVILYLPFSCHTERTLVLEKVWLYSAFGLISHFGYNAQILTVASRPPVARYRSMNRSRSMGFVCPFVTNDDDCMVVRLYTLRQAIDQQDNITTDGNRNGIKIWNLLSLHSRLPLRQSSAYRTAKRSHHGRT